MDELVYRGHQLGTDWARTCNTLRWRLIHLIKEYDQKRHRPHADSNHRPLIHKPDVLSTQPRSLTHNDMNFLNTINIVSQLLGLKNQTKTDGLVSQKSNFLKNLKKPRKLTNFSKNLKTKYNFSVYSRVPNISVGRNKSVGGKM